MKWKLALAQHPMYLLIREDTQCAERTPPWGAPDIESYIDRVRQNLAALRRYPDLKLGYEWSGVELELLAQDAPEVLGQMREYARQGRVQFYNGAYAQPHLQILSPEANLRQFEYGREAYRELGLAPVLTYAHQEASVHEQLPQLLQAFGFSCAAVPGFLSTLVWLDNGEVVLHGVRGPRFVQGNEFVSWQGLDRTQIPLYLHQPIPREMSLRETLAREAVLGRLRVPPILIDMPDMIDVSPEWMADRQDLEIVLLNEALTDRLKQAPPHARVRLYTHWSYLEGIRAEELSRANWKAERSALRAEALQALAFALLGRPPESTRPLWKTILTCQHHDVYCFSAPELRHKAIGWLAACEEQSGQMVQQAVDAISGSIDTQAVDGQPLVLFNTQPHPITAIAEIETSAGPVTARDEHGQAIASENVSLEDGLTRLRFLAGLPGLGYVTCSLHPGGEPAHWVETRQPFEFENRFYRAVVTPDGVFQSLKTQDGFELLARASAGGNRLSATDSSAISLKTEGTPERLRRLTGDPPLRGPELAWETASPSRLLRSPIGVTLQAGGRLGERIKARLALHFYYDLPRIDLSWTFEFDRASLGTFFDDDSKLLLRWPLYLQGEIHHDIPFGIVKTRSERPFFPTTWADISDGDRGVAFFHQGTPAHWVSQNTLFNLLAWGEDTDAIHNGLGRDRWLKSFDQRLNGTHVLNSAVYVHMGDWRSGDVPSAALAYNHPPLPVLPTAHSGALPPEKDVLHLQDPGLLSTAVFARGQQVVCRLYSVDTQPLQADAHLDGLQREGLVSIAGEPLSALTPYQIGELLLGRET